MNCQEISLLLKQTEAAGNSLFKFCYNLISLLAVKFIELLYNGTPKYKVSSFNNTMISKCNYYPMLRCDDFKSS